MMQMLGSKAAADGNALTCVTETDNAADDANAYFSERKKRRQSSDDVPALKRTVAAFRPWRINSITSHHLNTAFLKRRGWDSNPRYPFEIYAISNRAPSTTRPPLQKTAKEEKGFEPLIR